MLACGSHLRGQLDDNVAIDSINPDHFVTTECMKGHGDDTIVLPAGAVFQMNSIIDDAHNYMGPTATPIIFSNITIDANGSRLERTGNLNFRAFSIGSASVGAPNGNVSGTGNLTIRNAHIKDFQGQRRQRRRRRGGGMGAGGAIYLNGGGLTVENSTFESNSATGGNGSASCCGAGGGGGGVGGQRRQRRKWWFVHRCWWWRRLAGVMEEPEGTNKKTATLRVAAVAER